MRAVDARTEPVGIGDAGRGVVIAPRRTVAGVQLGNAFGADEHRVWPDEARMGADVDRGSFGPQHPCGLPDHGGEVFDVGVRPHGHGGVEGSVVEGKRIRWSLDDVEPAAAGNLKHVLGEVNADRRPAELGHRRGRHTGPTANVETAPLADAE